jgi:hypothetical protein
MVALTLLGFGLLSIATTGYLSRFSFALCFVGVFHVKLSTVQ